MTMQSDQSSAFRSYDGTFSYTTSQGMTRGGEMFITELPQDEYGNRAYTNAQAAVIEVNPVTKDVGGSRWDTWEIVGPDYFKEKWPAISPHAYSFLEIGGRACTASWTA